MADTPSSRIIADATDFVTDAAGRAISVRFPTSFLRMRLARFVGAELQSNQEWWGNAIVALSVTAIGEAPIIEPRNADQVETVIYRLDDDGMLAVAKWLKGEAERRSEDMNAIAKNSPSTPN